MLWFYGRLEREWTHSVLDITEIFSETKRLVSAAGGPHHCKRERHIKLLVELRFAWFV